LDDHRHRRPRPGGTRWPHGHRSPRKLLERTRLT
jgi:hypothetical protein